MTQSGMLSDSDLMHAMGTGELRIIPRPEGRGVQPASVELHLAAQVRIPTCNRFSHELMEGFIDPSMDQEPSGFALPPTGGLIRPGDFLLASTVETVELSRSVAARVEGKSSLGRCGLAIHATAGFIDPGFRGTITLELHNVGTSPVMLRPGMPIGQLCAFRLLRPCERPYGSAAVGSHYQGQSGPTPAKGI